MDKKVDDYLDGFEGERKLILEKYRDIILSSSDKLKEKVSWGMPSYYVNKYIIHFAGHKNHVGIYPGPDAIEKFEKYLKEYNHKKGTLQIKYTDEIPKELIENIIKYNLEKDKIQGE